MLQMSVSKKPRIAAVTFDVGGTLIEPWPSVGHVYAEVAAKHGFAGLPARLLNCRFAAAWRATNEFDHTRGDWFEIVDRTFAGLLPENAARRFFPELYERFAEASAWRMFDDVLPALKTLAAQGLKLGVISNWDDRLRPLLQSLKLAARFDAIVVSCEAGFSKPSPRIFRRAARELGMPAASILHVGDDAAADVKGARAAGFQAAQIARSAERRRRGQIRSLEDLPALVRAWAGKK
jgi:putative hydrolase of the HAD superfamily